ncbi:hypothetical protein A0257_21420 [Hymenobacter psoromatis]|nr:hypothetical protein A0257_21420 [Hymenobacter psoromatis]
MTRAMATVGAKWKPHLIYAIRERKARFGQLHAKLPHISRKVLAEQLRQLEEDGIVQRRELLSEPLPHVEYSLTAKGLALLPILFQLVAWDQQYAPTAAAGLTTE